MQAYRAMKQYDESRELLRTRLDAWRRRAEAGNVEAMGDLLPHMPKCSGEDATSEAIGDYWTRWAETHKDTRVELYCRRKAIDAYFRTPLRHRRLKREVMIEPALKAADRLRTQTMDPEVAWNCKYLDVNLLLELAAHEKGQQERFARALELLAKRIDESEDARNIRMRVNFGWLAEATDNHRKLGRRVLALMEQIRRESNEGDAHAMEGLEARLYFLLGEYARAERIYAKFAANAACAFHGYGAIRAVLNCARHRGGRAYKAALERYRSQIGEWQDVMPGLWYDVGRSLLGAKSRAVLAVRSILASRYPASGARGRLESDLAKAAKK